jgi:diguanylate cyclase (GGDEF)-like protein
MTEHAPARRGGALEPALYSLSQIRHLMRVEYMRAQRYGYPLACLMIAIDPLGPLRDRHGYDAKQALVDEVVRMLRAHTRGCDYLGRLADERLLAILPHTSAPGMLVAGERLIALARALDFRVQQERVPVTLSIGATHYANGNAMYFDQLIDSTERALAQAGAAGGDRLVELPPMPPQDERG